MSLPSCRFCGADLVDTFIDLGLSPLCEKFVTPDRLAEPDPVYPLHARVCRRCLLVQVDAVVTPEQLFSDYAYFSSYSDSWVAHARTYCDDVVRRFALGPEHRIVEVASNDGYLLQHFVARGLTVLGIEPAANVARRAVERGIPTEVMFFGSATAQTIRERYGPADLLVANNVLAHVPDLNDFVAGMKYLIGERGIVTIEFPHVVRLIEQSQFDTIYHEHFSYFSLATAGRVLDAHGLQIFDVEELRTHGGSLRIYAQHRDSGRHRITEQVARVLDDERRAGLDRVEGYRGMQQKADAVRDTLLAFLRRAKAEGKRVAGYGAPGKGNTLLNYCGIGPDLLEYTVDRNPGKHGLYTPGTRIPIHEPERLALTRPDYVLILPWNLEDEIVAQLAYIRGWGGQFVVAIPTVRLVATKN